MSMIEYKKSEIISAIDEYAAFMENIRQRRCIIDAEEIQATADLIKVINADNPKVFHPCFKSNIPS